MACLLVDRVHLYYETTRYLLELSLRACAVLTAIIKLAHYYGGMLLLRLEAFIVCLLEPCCALMYGNVLEYEAKTADGRYKKVYLDEKRCKKR